MTFREGLRLEQITAKLATLTDTQVDAAAFYDLVTKPTDVLLADYPWLLDAERPAEGRVARGLPVSGDLPAPRRPPRADRAEDLVRMMLDAFHDRVGGERLAVPAARPHLLPGLDARLDRRARGGPRRRAADDRRRLPEPDRRVRERQARPAQGRPDRHLRGRHDEAGRAPVRDWQQYVFWTLPEVALAEDQVLPEALAGYQTYDVRGLPPGPICTPSLPSIDAALEPDTTDAYIYFLAIPEGDGAHAFAKTLAEHETKLEEVRVQVHGRRRPATCRFPPTSPPRRWADAGRLGRGGSGAPTGRAWTACGPRFDGGRRRRLLRRPARSTCAT